MKKFLGLIILIAIIFLVTTNAFADNFGQLYVDYSVNGSLVMKSPSLSNVIDGMTHDARPFYIGADYWLDRFKIGAEYETVHATYHDTDVNSLLLKAGYSIFATDSFQFVISAGYGNYTINSKDIATKEEVTSIIMAYETFWRFEHSGLDMSILFPIDSDYKLNDIRDTGKDSALFQAKLKYTLFLSEQLGLSFGYHIDGFVLGDGNNNADTYADITKGFTIGATYLF